MTDLWVKAPALVALFDDEEDPVTAAQKQYLQLGFTYYGNVVESIGATLQEALTQVRKVGPEVGPTSPFYSCTPQECVVQFSSFGPT